MVAVASSMGRLRVLLRVPVPGVISGTGPSPIPRLLVDRFLGVVMSSSMAVDMSGATSTVCGPFGFRDLLKSSSSSMGIPCGSSNGIASNERVGPSGRAADLVGEGGAYVGGTVVNLFGVVDLRLARLAVLEKLDF